MDDRKQEQPPTGTPPPWMVTARAFIGLRETPGPTTAPAISNMLATLHAWWHDDETPWCGTFLAYCMEDAGLEIPKAWFRARAWADWGRPIRGGQYNPACGGNSPYGSIVVLERGNAGHVTSYVAPVRDRPDLFWGLGGNQGDMVKVSTFEVSRVLAVRWPTDYPFVDYRDASAAAIARASTTPVSRGEA